MLPPRQKADNHLKTAAKGQATSLAGFGRLGRICEITAVETHPHTPPEQDNEREQDHTKIITGCYEMLHIKVAEHACRIKDVSNDTNQ